MWKSVVISNSDKTDKRFKAVFKKEGKTKTIHFGQKGAFTYIDKAPLKIKVAYLARHSKNNENWNIPDTAGSLSRWIIWGPSNSVNKNISEFKKKFKLV